MKSNQKGIVVLPILVIFIIVTLIGYIGFQKTYLLKKRTINNQPASEAISPANTNDQDSTLSWKTYINQQYKYKFKYPQESTLRDQSVQYVAVSYMGEKQKATGRTQTELFDGYAFNVADVTNDGYEDLDDFYNSKVNELKDMCTSIGEPSETKIDGERAITQKLSCLGDYDAYYFKHGDFFFEASLLYVGDAEDMPKYIETVNLIFSTFSFMK